MIAPPRNKLSLGEVDQVMALGRTHTGSFEWTGKIIRSRTQVGARQRPGCKVENTVKTIRGDKGRDAQCY
ncbi:hypothetical protein SAMN04489751_3376 [Brevibacterium sandarakinum]|uniref:Uncharacterized protein n=1 Tax=Brevibacterium sandarakinum TaxID=629680 RepID=A0A1H1WKV8_BRESA|nr:hypothetical protein SAMN04489751_3376 [Brevibacterium sandarakinum]